MASRRRDTGTHQPHLRVDGESEVTMRTKGRFREVVQSEEGVLGTPGLTRDGAERQSRRSRNRKGRGGHGCPRSSGSSRGPGRKGEGGRLTKGREASVESVLVAQEAVAATAAPEVTELTQERRPAGLANVTDNYRLTVKFHPRPRCTPVLLQTQLGV